MIHIHKAAYFTRIELERGQDPRSVAAVVSLALTLAMVENHETTAKLPRSLTERETVTEAIRCLLWEKRFRISLEIRGVWFGFWVLCITSSRPQKGDPGSGAL